MKTSLLSILLALVSIEAFAYEPELPTPQAIPPPPGTPIDQFLLPMLGLAIVYGVYVYYKRLQKS